MFTFFGRILDCPDILNSLLSEVVPLRYDREKSYSLTSYAGLSCEGLSKGIEFTFYTWVYFLSRLCPNWSKPGSFVIASSRICPGDIMSDCLKSGEPSLFSRPFGDRSNGTFEYPYDVFYSLMSISWRLRSDEFSISSCSFAISTWTNPSSG